jgi:nucleoside-diphosphate-sugar epimerase
MKNRKMKNKPNVLVTGATNQIGQFLLPHLQAADFTITAISRYPQPNRAGITWQQVDLSNSTVPININYWGQSNIN